jgi:hypothetical protein
MSEPFPVCPTCGGYIPNNYTPGAYPGALSRKDNQTEICSACGTAEALAGYIRHEYVDTTETVAGWYLPAGTEVSPVPVLVPTLVAKLAEMIGGGCQYVEAVNGGMLNLDTGEADLLVGFIDEDGISNKQQINYLATVLFQREDYLLGDCYVVSTTNPDSGEYDGEAYDIPDELTNVMLRTLELETANQYNWLVMMYSATRVAMERGVLTQDDFDNAQHDEDKAEELVEMIQQYAEVVVNSMATADDDLDDIIDNELKGMLDDN